MARRILEAERRIKRACRLKNSGLLNNRPKLRHTAMPPEYPQQWHWQHRPKTEHASDRPDTLAQAPNGQQWARTTAHHTGTNDETRLRKRSRVRIDSWHRETVRQQGE
jgi:hypothetical protein